MAIVVDVRLLLVVGTQRSGTTMLASMLGNEPTSLVLPDSGLLSKLGHLGNASSSVTSADFQNVIQSVRRIRQWPVDRKVLLSADLPTIGTVREMFEAWVSHFATITGKQSPQIVISHEPTDVAAIPLIVLALQDVSMVHIIRDGRAVAASTTKTSWGHAALSDAAAWWAEQVGLGLAAERYLLRLGLPVHSCRFEDLVAEPTAVLESLCHYLGFSGDPETWTGGAFQPLASSRSDHLLVGLAPQPERASAWQDDLDHEETTLIEQRVGGMLRLLGYPVSSIRPPGRVVRIRDFGRRHVVTRQRRVTRSAKSRIEKRSHRP